ncbi:LysR family transcriptional regulator [Pantoea sp. VS1]|uniref:LysR family transcriptional regulator n=1 Tax=Pantoea sp. VS1 TaxID=2003658 RepID=UPI000B510489|nr:LysR family transcriptional regulator [Pantoea sp. VS1]OWS73983.1 LysR family transcriptional regulator [Pantoea sp. VS1]
MKILLAGKSYQKPLQGWPSIEDLYVFISVARHDGFGRAAIELGQSPSYISKRIAILEKQLETRLFFRTNRVMRLTPEGEKALEGALQVVQEMDGFLNNFRQWRGELTGEITVGCSFGFGQDFLSDAVSAFIHQHPSLNIKLMLSDRAFDLLQSGTDVEICVGDDLNPSYIARRLIANRRILCAAPAYLSRAGMPASLDALIHHSCLIINERDNSFGNWALTNGEQQVLCRLNSHYSSNSGKVILHWALQGHGIALRSAWDVAPYLATGELVAVLPQWYQEANIWAVYTQRAAESQRIKVFLDFLAAYFNEKSLPEMTGRP